METSTHRPSSGSARNDTNPCGTEGHPCLSFGVQERPRYFPRQLITPGELTLEADYFRDKHRRHNVFLHGWGVVCDALVCVVPAKVRTAGGQAARTGIAEQTSAGGRTEPWVVSVQPGYVLGPYGDEILIDCAREVPLRGSGVSGGGPDYSDDLTDPWCSEVYVNHPTGALFVAVRYREFQVRPVLAQPASCGCDDMQCESSRFRDGYEIGVLDNCPPSQTPQAAKDGVGGRQRNPVCPPCPDSPWVILAEVKVDTNGTVTLIDNCSCRRIVSSTRDSWLRCGGTESDYPPKAASQPEDGEAKGDASSGGTTGGADPTPAPRPALAPAAKRTKPRRTDGG